MAAHSESRGAAFAEAFTTRRWTVSQQTCLSAGALSGFVLGTIPGGDLERIVRHLDGCPACEAAVRALESVSDPVLAAIRHTHFGESSKPQAPNPNLELGGLDLGFTAGGGRRLGDFHILREVGRGGMGVVHEAEQVSLGRRVALKVLPRHALLDPNAVQRFQRESRAAARLHHTNIVQVFGTGEQDGLHYFVVQLIPGVVVEELKQLQTGYARKTQTPTSKVQPERLGLGAWPVVFTSAASPSGRSSWVSVARIGIRVADALAFAHAQGIVHRDIKPSNLLLDPGGTVWVTGFGLAKETAGEDDLTGSSFLMGTLRYVPPERFRGQSDARGDVEIVRPLDRDVARAREGLRGAFALVAGTSVSLLVLSVLVLVVGNRRGGIAGRV
jgi:serine/threonine protein kinase